MSAGAAREGTGEERPGGRRERADRQRRLISDHLEIRSAPELTAAEQPGGGGRALAEEHGVGALRPRPRPCFPPWPRETGPAPSPGGAAGPRRRANGRRTPVRGIAETRAGLARPAPQAQVALAGAGPGGCTAAPGRTGAGEVVEGSSGRSGTCPRADPMEQKQAKAQGTENRLDLHVPLSATGSAKGHGPGYSSPSHPQDRQIRHER